MHNHHTTIILLLILIVSASCGPLTPVPVTEPPAPTEASAPTPTPGLNPTGPYVLYAGEKGIWISNPDGSFLTQLTNLGIREIGLDFHRLLSPQGDRLVWVISIEGNVDLMEVKIPSGETKTIAHLLKLTPEDLNSEPPNERATVAYVINNYNVVWQPGEGRFLAFMGAMNGRTSKLYIYDTKNGEITRLSDGPALAMSPIWSPDGKYIVYAQISGLNPMASETSNEERLDGVWAVRVADGEIIPQPTPNGNAFIPLGWQDDRHYITYESTLGSGKACSFENLRSVDVTSGEATPITDLGIKDYIAYSPENGAILFTGTPACEYSAGKGTFLLLPGQAQPTKLLEEEAAEVLWLPESQVFFAFPEALFSSDGKTRYDPPIYGNSFQPALSPKGYQAWEVIINGHSHLEIKVPGANWQQISVTGPIDQMIWDPVSGETLLLTTDSEGGTLYAASYPDFELRTIGMVPGVKYAVWLR